MRNASKLMFFSFVGVQLLGLFMGWQFIRSIQQGILEPVFENPESLFNALYLFGYILVSVLVLFGVLYFYKGKRLFFVLELAIVFASAQIFFLILFPSAPEILLFLLPLLLVVARWKYPKTKTGFLLFASAIIGPYIGTSFDLTSTDFAIGPAVLVVLLFALYDVIAVFGTKHMVTLAKELDKREAAFAVSFKYKKELVQLGTGNLVLPSVIITSSLKLSLLHSVFALAGAVFGLLFLIYLLERKRGYYPALPPIIAGSLVFLAAYHFVGLSLF